MKILKVNIEERANKIKAGFERNVPEIQQSKISEKAGFSFVAKQHF
jgi:hypothetical protein